MNRQDCAPSRSHRKRSWIGLGSLVLMTIAMVGGLLLPSTAEARGRRTVPDLRNPRAVQGPSRATATTIGLTVHIATENGVPIATRRQVAQWIQRANDALAPHGLAVQLHQQVTMTGNTEVTRRRDRRRLASMAAHDGTIHVFVANNLDPPAVRVRRRIRGLHWRYLGLNRELRQREFVVVTLGAPKTTFAHEIGHLLGLRHSTSENNIMCSCRRGSNTTFTAEQGSSMRIGAGRFNARQSQAQRRAVVQRDRTLARSRRRR